MREANESPMDWEANVYVVALAVEIADPINVIDGVSGGAAGTVTDAPTKPGLNLIPWTRPRRESTSRRWIYTVLPSNTGP
jgi:hypothetical protein